MLKFKHPLLLIAVAVLLVGGVGAYAFISLSPGLDVSPAPVERLSEIDVSLTEENRLEYEQKVVELTAQIAEKETAGTYVLDLYFQRAIAYQRLGKLALAFADFEVVIAGDPGNETAWNNLGDIVIDMGDVNAAEAYYQKAIEQYASEVAYNKLYRYYTTYRTDDRDAYVPALLELALADHPDNVSFYVKLGRWYFEHNDKENAVEAYRQAAVRSPESEEVRAELQQALDL